MSPIRGVILAVGVVYLMASPWIVRRYEHKPIYLFGYRWESDGSTDSQRALWRRRTLYALAWLIGLFWVGFAAGVIG